MSPRLGKRLGRVSDFQIESLGRARFSSETSAIEFEFEFE